MTDTLTLLELRTRVRQRADMENSSFVSDSELNGYINESYKELYDLLIESGEDYFITSTTFTITSGNTQALPATFYKLKGVDDLTDPNSPATVGDLPFAERNMYNEPFFEVLPQYGSNVRYRVMGSNLAFYPITRAQKTYRLWYVPTVTIMTSDSDTCDGIQGWNEYVVVDAAIKCRIKEESSTTELNQAKVRLVSRIQSMKRDRDQSAPEKVARVRTRQNAYNPFYTPTGG